MRDLNFFSEHINSESSAKRKKAIVLGVLAGIIAMMAVIYGITAMIVGKLETDIQKSRDYLESSEVAQSKKELEAKKARLALLKQYDEAVTEIKKTIDDSDKVRSELIEKINGTLPSGVRVLNFTVSQQNVNISAEAGSRIQIAELEHNLMETELFNKVHIGAVNNKDETGIFSFTIDCILKEVIK
jgi:Tfp pilus assembly protein PilN